MDFLNRLPDYFEFCKGGGIVSHTMVDDVFIYDEDSVLVYEMATGVVMTQTKRDFFIEFEKTSDYLAAGFAVYIKLGGLLTIPELTKQDGEE